MKAIEPLIMAMIAYDAKDPKRIQHFLKVYEFTHLIATAEGIGKAEREIVEAAAVVHDIGIKISEEKYNSSAGKYQELEGPPLAAAMLRELGYAPDFIERVCWLVGHHHSYGNIEALDHQILVEADFLVNIYEDAFSAQASESVCRKVFKTASGKKLWETMYPASTQEQHMLIDLTLPVTPEMRTTAEGNEKKTLTGHLGTHFDVMDKEFPLDYVERPGVAFDVSAVTAREIGSKDIDLSKVREGMFVALYSGFIEREGYGSAAYFSEHPELSEELIEKLVEKKISVIGIDFAGMRRGREHTPKDRYCADRGVFVVENLCNLGALLDGENTVTFGANTYPIRFGGMTGLPCRVVAKR